MSKFLAKLLCSALLLVRGPFSGHAPTVAPLEKKASHQVTFLDTEGQPRARCTMTAIAPAAFLTAAHCNDGAKPSEDVNIDLSTQIFHLVAVTDDGRDHVIYLLDKSIFTNFVDIVPGSATEKIGDAVHMYGCGGGEYPCILKNGLVTNIDDTSDVDQASSFVEYSIPVISGDSGSAIYNDKNEVVALVTYGITAQPSGFWNKIFGRHEVHYCGAFNINFNSKQILIAKDYNPESILGK